MTTPMQTQTERDDDKQAIAEVIDFWQAAGPAAWFTKDPDFDLRFREHFLQAHMAAARRELDHWASSPNGGLALLILLDQFPRNAFRGTAHMFATDPLALHFAEAIVEAGFDTLVDPALRLFCYLPFEHSESLTDQERSVLLHSGLDASLRHYAEDHHRIIARFGRFPHRNASLGRATTAQEQAFLDEGGFAG